MELDTEKFKALKELSEIQIAISQATALFDEIKNSTEAYKQLREKETIELVQNTLLASREVIAEAERNHDVVTSLVYEAENIVADSHKLLDYIKDQVETNRTVIKQTELLIKEKTEALILQKNQLEKERAYLEGERKNLGVRKKKLGDQEQKLAADMEMLQQDIARLRKV